MFSSSIHIYEPATISVHKEACVLSFFMCNLFRPKASLFKFGKVEASDQVAIN